MFYRISKKPVTELSLFIKMKNNLSKIKLDEWDDYGRPKIPKPKNWDEVFNKWKHGEITAVVAMMLTGLKRSTLQVMS